MGPLTWTDAMALVEAAGSCGAGGVGAAAAAGATHSASPLLLPASLLLAPSMEASESCAPRASGGVSVPPRLGASSVKVGLNVDMTPTESHCGAGGARS